MKLRITIEDRVYVVDAEVIDEPLPRPALQAIPAEKPPPPEPPKPPKPRDIPESVTTHVEGTIRKVHAKIGARVSVGDPLVDIEAPPALTPGGGRTFAGTLRFPVSGEVCELPVKEGERVSANQVLAKVR
ncbi:MAG: hypothetical protein IBJ11_03360 [Phycisphaerales bacterium]|nr:hypothetical protein [Phycisphaerales bacterium]